MQNDFMLGAAPGGRLYVRHLGDESDRGAEQIIPTLARVERWMERECDALVLSGDWHSYDDREIVRADADFRNTYPPHCMGLSPDAAERAGAALIEQIVPTRPMVRLGRDATPREAEEAARCAVEAHAPVFVEKREFSVWHGNPQMAHFVEALTRELGAKPEVLIAGVASDVCVHQAIDGFLARGFPVTVIADAIYSLGSASDDEIVGGWKGRGARVVTSEALGVGREA